MQQANHRRGFVHRLPDQAWLAAILLLILLCTKGFYLADTNFYVSEITDSFREPAVGTGKVLWEFGHLLWRPLGWILVRIIAPALIPLTGWDLGIICSALLVGVSMILGVLTVLLWYSIALDVTDSRLIAFLVAIGFACSNSFLTYLHAGTSYVPGLFCVTLALWLIRVRQRRGGPGAGLITASASATPLATLLWFPYVFSVPGILFAGVWLSGRPLALTALMKPETRRFMLHFAAVFVLWLFVGFGIGAWAGGIHSVTEARGWVIKAKHGWLPTDRVKRLATGIPRSFIHLGDDAILYRRFLRKDPYAPVSRWDLIRGGVWKIFAFTLFAGCLLYELSRRAAGYWALCLTLAGGLPVLLFAALIFEPSSPERYLPALPFLIVAAAWCLRDLPRTHRTPQLCIVAFLACMVLTNIYFMNRRRIDREDAVELVRVSAVQARHNEQDLIRVITIQDNLRAAVNRELFSPVNRPVPLRLYEIVPFATSRLAAWRQEFADHANVAWARGGEVWVSKRAWQPEPLREWNWVENEDRLVSWKQIVAFFSALATDGDLGGSDGFLRVPPNYANRKLLETFSTKNAPHSSRPDLPEQVLVAADTCEFEELSDIFSSDKIPQPLGARLRLLGPISRAVIYRPSFRTKQPGIPRLSIRTPWDSVTKVGEDLSEG